MEYYSSRSNGFGEKWIKHYSSFHKILLVGEGDFSFALCLANAFGSASNIVATSLDSQVEVEAKYSKAKTHLKQLREMGCTIIHEVDVYTMNTHPLLLHSTFDRIVYNFPHAPLLWKESDPLQISYHRGLVRGFMMNAREMLSRKGEVHVTHKTSHPFSQWKIEEVALEVGLNKLIGADRFCIWEYPGYENKRGFGILCDLPFPIGECTTFKFAFY